MVRETVEITGEVIQDEEAGAPVRYYHLERGRFDCVQSCQGDLVVICNALADYAGLLSEYLEEEGGQLDACGRIQYELHEYFVLCEPVSIICCVMGGNRFPNIRTRKVASQVTIYSILSEYWLNCRWMLSTV